MEEVVGHDEGRFKEDVTPERVVASDEGDGEWCKLGI
jgi:hypothetical protein